MLAKIPVAQWAAAMPVTAAVPEAHPRPAAVQAAAVAAEARRVATELGQEPQARRLTIRLRPVMLFLLAAVVVVVLLSLVQDLLIFLLPEAGFSDRIYRLDLDAEASLPAWFSSGLMLICALALLAIALQVSGRGWLKALPWFLLTAAFFVLSLDEIATLHEGLSAALSARIDNTGLFYFAWTLPALVACLAGLACFVPFILSFKGFDRALLIGSAVVFLSGAVGMEMLGGAEAEASGIATLHYRLLATLEESLEFVGLLIFLTFLLRRLRADHNRMTICFE
jgi:hypothetical protein